MKSNYNFMVIIGIIVVVAIVMGNGDSKKEAVYPSGSVWDSLSSAQFQCGEVAASASCNSGSACKVWASVTYPGYYCTTYNGDAPQTVCTFGGAYNYVEETACNGASGCGADSGAWSTMTAQSIPQFCGAARPVTGGNCAADQVLKLEKCLNSPGNPCCYNGQEYNYGEARADACEVEAGCDTACTTSYGSCGGTTLDTTPEVCLGFQRPKTETCGGNIVWSVCSGDTTDITECCGAIQYSSCAGNYVAFWIQSNGIPLSNLISGQCTNSQKFEYRMCGSAKIGKCVETTNCLCSDTTWSPATSTQCVGESVLQTSNCGNTRYVSGTTVPICADKSTKSCGQQYTASNTECLGITCPDLGTQCATGTCQANGQCGTTCFNDCSTSGLKECSSLYSWHTCGESNDGDTCLDWLSSTNCGVGQTCSGAGICSGCVSDNNWSPDPSTVCSGLSFNQTDNCGNVRGATGTRIGCGGGDDGNSTSSQCMTFIQQCGKDDAGNELDCSTSADNCVVNPILYFIGIALAAILALKMFKK